MAKNPICSIDDVHFYMTDFNGIPVVSRVEIIENHDEDGFFNDPVLVCEKQRMFRAGENVDNDRFSELRVDSTYNYALTSALLKKVTDILKDRGVYNQPEKKEHEKDDTPEDIKDIVNTWRKENENNKDFFRNSLTVKAPTRYYIGKQGDAIAKAAGLDKLNVEDLIAIEKACEYSKGIAASDAKKNGGDGWSSPRKSLTPEGIVAQEKVRSGAMLKEGYIDRVEYNDNMRKAKYRAEKQKEIFNNLSVVDYADIKSISSQAIDTLILFNRYFCLNAINKDGVYGEGC